MSNVQGPGPSGSGSEWLDVTRSHERGKLQRDGAWAIVSRGGHVRYGAEATDWHDEIARVRGCDPNQHLVAFKASTKTGEVGAYATTDSAPGTTTARRYVQDGTVQVTFLMSGLFEQYPSLRPKHEVKCVVTRATAPDGLPMLSIAVKAGIRTGGKKASNSRSGSTSNSRSGSTSSSSDGSGTTASPAAESAAAEEPENQD